MTVIQKAGMSGLEELNTLCRRCEMSAHCSRLDAKCKEYKNLECRVKMLDTIISRWEKFKEQKLEKRGYTGGDNNG